METFHIQVSTGGLDIVTDEYFEEVVGLWEEAIAVLGIRTYKIAELTAVVRADWRPFWNYLRSFTPENEDTSTDKLLIENGKSRVQIEFFDSETPCEVLEAYYDHIVQEFLLDVFTVMNLSIPGSCEFYELDWKRDPFVSKAFRGLSASQFDMARDVGCGLPELSPNSLAIVIDWYEATRTELKQLPEGRGEKVIFALWHLARLDMSQVSVIWIFYALETLFDTKPGENFGTLYERVVLLLELEDREASELKRKLRKLYNFRSGMVHGGWQVWHPYLNDVLDHRLLEQYDKHIDTCGYGIRIILASLSRIFLKGWLEPKFTQKVGG